VANKLAAAANENLKNFILSADLGEYYQGYASVNALVVYAATLGSGERVNFTVAMQTLGIIESQQIASSLVLWNVEGFFAAPQLSSGQVLNIPLFSSEVLQKEGLQIVIPAFGSLNSFVDGLRSGDQLKIII
jgi:hypothetical protein